MDETALPDWMNTTEMRQAMNTLKLFSEKERDYHAYQARQNYLREQRTIQIEREEDLREMERIKLEKKQLEQEKERVEQEKERVEQEKERVEQEKEQLQHDMEQTQQDLHQERIAKQSALDEIERLKALLSRST